MVRGVPPAFALLIVLAVPAAAQAPATESAEPSETVTEPAAPPVPRTMVGTWEFSNADREKICAITFRESGPYKPVTFDQGCAGHFAFTKEITAWSHAENDFLRLLDGRGQTMLEFSEVEGGIFEAPRPGEGILFIQNPSSLGPAPRTAEQVTGEWSVVRRAGRPICGLSLSDTPAPGDEFVVKVQPPCDRFVAGFGPATWSMDRGELVLKSARGATWRFEAAEDAKWRRVPDAADPVVMVRK
jgi:Protease inhibitor Inh